MRRLALTLLLSCLSVAANASPAWINDHILVPMRSGAGGQFRITHSAIASGTRVNLLGVEGDWTKVQYKGETGYIASQYITRSPTASIQLATLQKKYAALEDSYKDAKTTLAATSAERDKLDTRAATLKKQLSSSNDSLKHIKTVAADPLRISQTNRELNEKLSLLQTKLDQLKVKNSLLEHNSTYKGWAFGLGTVILGMLFGAWLKSRSKRTRSSWV